MKSKKLILALLVLCFILSATTGCTSEKEQGNSADKVDKEAAEWGVDFIVDVEEGREVKVLQISDTQIVDATQCRTPERLNTTHKTMWGPGNMEEWCFKYITDAVERVKPDFIILTGDLVYGEFDDSGASMKALTQFMDSFKIPWSPVLGDKDAMSKLGGEAQCEILANAEYCYFRKGNTDGYGNYSVGIRQGKELTRAFYMMHSCPVVKEGQATHCFTDAQVEWLYKSMEQTDEVNEGTTVKKSVCFHTPTQEFVYANMQYQNKGVEFTINETVKGQNGDCGSVQEKYNIYNAFSVQAYDGIPFVKLLQDADVDSVFAGHCLGGNSSVLYEDIRWTFGLYTTNYDWPISNQIGGVQVTFNQDELAVKYVYYDKEYQEYIDNLDFF